MIITISNRLAVLIRQRQINSASEFGRRMTASGYPMSSSHASRYLKDEGPALDLRFINVACNVLQCLPNELYEITVELEAGEDVDPLVILPRHAIVINRNTLSSTTGHPIATPVQAKAPAEAKQPAEVKEKGTSKPSKNNSTIAPDTGPTGTIFPFIKE
ncbi:MAG: helix-turn-helix transcriptional regulator [Pseudomonadota bacterium]|nr:helix-turn-helix transcriptional regulator [Pseudomonadota bacterium]